MCGATGAQTQLQDEQMQAYQQAQQMTAEQYADQQAVYAPLKAQFDKIFAAGPNQQGFSEEETNTLNAQAVEGTAENYAQAAKATGEAIAAEGGGTNPLPSGAQSEMQQQVAEKAAQSESGEETQIQEANYNQGYQEWQQAGSGLMSIAAGDNPVGYETAATGAGTAAGTTANQIAQENNSWINAAIGAAGDIGGGLASAVKF
ncbi:MAG: hypothetical protein ABSG60_10175 [Terracidiphilus sp.]